MDTNLAAETRTATGKGVARKLRAAGKIPAVLYGANKAATSISVDPKQLTDIFRISRNRNTIVNLELDGATVPTLVLEAQRHPVSRDILHVDFMAVEAGKIIEVMVPLRAVGRPAGAALGGRLRLIRRAVKTRCSYENIPEAFDIDVSPMHIGDMIKASEIATPEGVEVVIDNDFNVLTVYGKRGGGKKK